jgi:AcrR family transcriptional regulator
MRGRGFCKIERSFVSFLNTTVRSAHPSRPRRLDRARALHKGQQTRAAILDAALTLASHMGLEGLSIGALAEVTGMSKSGVFAHFGSREELQISVIREYHHRFEEEVFFPRCASRAACRGCARCSSAGCAGCRWSSTHGCIYISGAVEFDDRPGPVRDALVSMVRSWHDRRCERAIGLAIEDGHLRPRHRPVQQMLFEIHGLILACTTTRGFLRIPGATDRARRASSACRFPRDKPAPPARKPRR